MKNKKYKIGMLVLLLTGIWAPQASATYMANIEHSLTSHSGNTYLFDFKVKNISDGASSGALDFFLINLDAGDMTQYASATWVNDKNWASLAFDYDDSFGGVPGGVAADDSVLGSNGGGIAQGGSLGGFRVSFNYTGTLNASDKLFSYIAMFGTSLDPANPLGYSVLGSVGDTTLGQNILYTTPAAVTPVPYPEPATMLLMGTGFAGILGAIRRKKA